jgi:hypothetical protein
VVKGHLVSLLTDGGEMRSFELHGLRGLELLDAGLRRDLEYYLRVRLSTVKKDARTFTFFAQGAGKRTIQLSYLLEAPVWKATYRILLGEEGKPPTLQGWAVVDNTQDEDWTAVELSLVAGLPVSFVHDLYTPRFIRRPVVEVKQTTGVLPPMVESGMAMELAAVMMEPALSVPMAPPAAAQSLAGGRAEADVERSRMVRKGVKVAAPGLLDFGPSSTPAQVRERQLGDLFEYAIEHPVTIKRNQSALVPIVLRPFEGKPVLLYNKATRAENPLRAVQFKNTTGLTLEGGPVTVLEGGSYVGEAMLDTLKPGEERLVPYAVELSVKVLDNIDSHEDRAHRVVISEGRMWRHTLQVEKTTYHFTSQGDVEQTVYLDHPRNAGDWKLHDSPEPCEVTENYWRFRFTLPPKKTTAFPVTQRILMTRGENLFHLTPEQLGVWLEQRYLDAATQAVLKRVLELQARISGLERQRSELQEERNGIHLEQQRLRDNLQALGDRPSEKELRERFVATLVAQEDRLGQIDREFKAKSAEAEQVKGLVRETLRALVYDAAVT